MVAGFSFTFPEQLQGHFPETHERVVFINHDGDMPKLVATGIVNRVEGVFATNE